MKVLITGFPGTGKSAIALELKRRGHRAYDPDIMRGYEYTVDRHTGERIHPPQPIPAGWYDITGLRMWDPVKMSRLLLTSDDVFICSFVHDLANYRHLFDHIFVLTLDDVVLERRLRGRLGNQIGKDPAELRDIMKLHREFERTMLAHGATALNAEHGIRELVNTILEQVESNS